MAIASFHFIHMGTSPFVHKVWGLIKFPRVPTYQQYCPVPYSQYPDMHGPSGLAFSPDDDRLELIPASYHVDEPLDTATFSLF